MLQRVLLCAGILVGTVLPATIGSASARSDDARHWNDGVFQPVRKPALRPAEQRFRLDSSDDSERFRIERVRPKLTYSLIEGGPTLEVSALGGGRKGSPKLAHVKFGWRF